MKNLITPCYIYDLQKCIQEIHTVKCALPKIPLTYSMKANPLIVKEIEKYVDHIEVCSPGEFEICRNIGISGEKIIYSGVMKEEKDIREALSYRVSMITAESTNQIHMIEKEARLQKCIAEVLLRVSNGNQFGMDEKEVFQVIDEKNHYRHVRIIGLHYYTGTQKKTAEKVRQDLNRLKTLAEQLEKRYHYTPELIEYGPGLAVEYFSHSIEQDARTLLKGAAEAMISFAGYYKLGIEMGRFLTSSCGEYYTEVKEIKRIGETWFVITDGGIHHLNYYGQNMAMRKPPVSVVGKELEPHDNMYCLCGCLCTVADVLVREIELPELRIGDILKFSYCGAYSATESHVLFLSRELPVLYISDGEHCELRREAYPTCMINFGKGCA